MEQTDRVVEGAPSIEELEAIAREHPNDVEAMRQLGWAHYGLGQAEKAIEALSRALEREPAHVETNYALGLALRQAGQFERAKQAFSQALAQLDNVKSPIRAEMLRKLAIGNINQIDHGDWGLKNV